MPKVGKSMEKQLNFKPLLVLKVSEDLTEDFNWEEYEIMCESMPDYHHLLIFCNQDKKYDIEFYHCDNVDEITEKKVNELINLTMQNNG